MSIQSLWLGSLLLRLSSGSDPSNGNISPDVIKTLKKHDIMMRRSSDNAQNAVAKLSGEHLAAVESRLKKFEKKESEQMAAEKAKLKSIEDRHKTREQALEEKLQGAIAGLQNRIDTLTGRLENHTRANVKHHDSASQGHGEYYYDSAPAPPPVAASSGSTCRCSGGDFIGAECTRDNSEKRWCYVSDVTGCNHFATGVGGQYSYDPCNADRTGISDPFAVPENFNKDEYQGPCPPADPICTGQNETNKEELDEEILITEEMIKEVANYRCCENLTVSNRWKYHLKQKKVPDYCKEAWFKAKCLDINGDFMPSEGSGAPNLTDAEKLDECETCNSCFQVKTEKTKKKKCKFWSENQVSIPDHWTKAISDEAIAAAHNEEDLSKFTNDTSEELAEECDGPFSRKDGETCSNFYIAAHMYPVVILAALSVLACMGGLGAYAYYGDHLFVMLGRKPKEPPTKERKGSKKAKYAKGMNKSDQAIDDVLADLDDTQKK